MKLPDKVYTVLKWITLILIPALTTAYVGLAAIWGKPFIYPDEMAKTSAVICTLLGALLGISTAEYNRGGYVDDEEDIWPDEVDDEDE
jgi:TRAP-type C4-dicarboxylate transport system permease small subunit